MARLPQPGGDDNQWGDILNDFLKVEHNADGTQKPLPQSKVTNLTTDLASKVPDTRTVNGQALNSDITLSKSDVGLSNVNNTSDTNKPVSTAQQTALDAKINLTEKAATNGVATLDSSGKVPLSQLTAQTAALSVVTIAASNSRNRTAADYQCDGTADQTEIQTAINAATGPTSIQLMDGAFSFTGPVTFPANAADIEIIGAGMYTTTIAGNPGVDTAFFNLTQAGGQTLRRIRFANFTLDGRSMSTPSSTGVVSLGMIRDIGAGAVENLSIEDIWFRGGSTYNTTPITSSSDTGTNKRWRISACRIEHDGNRLYGIQIRKKTQGVWIESNHVELTGASAVAPYNAIAVYAGSSDFHVNGNTVIDSFSGAHCAIACSPASNGEITGNVVYGAPGATEGGIEIEFKTGHGDDATTSHDITVTGNVVIGAGWGIYVTNRDHATLPALDPYGILISGNVLESCTSRGIMLDYGTDLGLGANVFRNIPDSQKVEITANASGYGEAGPTRIRGGVAPSAPIAASLQVANGEAFLPNEAGINMGNAAGTTFQKVLRRASTNFVIVKSGGGDETLTLDTSGRTGIGPANIIPSNIEIEDGGVAVWNQRASQTAAQRATRVTIRQSDGQVAAGAKQNTELLRFTKFASATTVMSGIRSDGLVAGSAGVATKYKAGTPTDADFDFAPPDGTMVVDSSASKIWARIGGVWKSATLT